MGLEGDHAVARDDVEEGAAAANRPSGSVMTSPSSALTVNCCGCRDGDVARKMPRNSRGRDNMDDLRRLVAR